MSLSDFIDDFKNKSKNMFLAIYNKPQIMFFLKLIGVDATPNNTKDDLYKRLKYYFIEHHDQDQNIQNLRGG